MVRMLKGGNRGHIGSTLSLIEIMRVLYDDIMKHDPKNPDWEGRDVCVLSKGHGVMAQYACLRELGWIGDSELQAYFHDGTRLKGLSEAHVPGCEASSGSLGHGLSVGVR